MPYNFRIGCIYTTGIAGKPPGKSIPVLCLNLLPQALVLLRELLLYVMELNEESRNHVIIHYDQWLRFAEVVSYLSDPFGEISLVALCLLWSANPDRIGI